MPDWKKIVRDKLGTLPLTNGRRDEVIEELAQQLESAYEEALAQGINEQEAMRRSLDQFKNWEKLRSEVFQSVEGASLPVWEQNGFFAPRRWPVWIILVMTLSLLLAPAFRQALAILPAPGTDPTAWGSRIFPDKVLRRIEQSGDKLKHARALAFVALHSPKEDGERAMHAAENAIALDPRLTWISAKVSHATYSFPGYDPHPWIERLNAWDPQNGFPYLLEADANVHWWEPPWTSYRATKGGVREDLASEPRWRIPMEKAFAAPRLDFYSAQQFALDRQVLQEQGFDRPDVLIVGMWSQPMPDFVAMNFYVDILLNDVGAKAEKAGHGDDALAACERVVRFGERLWDSSSYHYSLQLLSTKYRMDAYQKMAPLLRRQGRAEQSANVEASLKSLLEPAKRRPAFLSYNVGERSGRIVLLSGLFLYLFFAATVAWLTALGILRWKPNLSAVLNRLASVLCLAPALLLFSSLGLFLGYYPYARHLGQYASLEELEQGFRPFLMGLWAFPALDAFTDMFWPTVWCALVALVGASSLWLMRRARQNRPDSA